MTGYVPPWIVSLDEMKLTLIAGTFFYMWGVIKRTSNDRHLNLKLLINSSLKCMLKRTLGITEITALSAEDFSNKCISVQRPPNQHTSK